MMRAAPCRPVAALALAVLLVLVGRPARAQLLPNGDFATGGTPPAGWFLDPAAATKGAMTIHPASSGAVLELSPNAANAPSDKPLGIGQLLAAHLVRGKTLTVTATLAATGGAHAVVGAVVLGTGAAIQLRDQGDAPATRQDRLTVPDDDKVQGVVLFLAAEGTAGVARFAAVDVTAGASAQPAALPQPGPDIAADIRITAGHVLRSIPAGLFGTNIEVIRDANGLWQSSGGQPSGGQPDAGRLDPDIVRLARDMGVTMVRFPGGVWSDAYDWHNGVGPAARRPRTPIHPGAEETDANRFGTDEALAFAHAIGADLLLTVNAGSGTPELAADWVRYVNGAGGHTPRDGRVTWWEIGNELYMKDDLSGGSMSAAAYADRVVRFATAMRAVDPGVRIAAIGLRNFGRYRFNSDDRWNETVLRRAGNAIDLLAVHDAYAPLVGDGAGLDAADVYAALWAAPRLIAQNLRDTRQDIERFAPAAAGRIRLGVTEWGPLFAVTPTSPWIDHVKTLGSAVFVAAMLQVLASDPDVELADFFKLNEASFMGWIGRRGGAWVPTAPYQAFRLVATGMERGLLATRVDVATYDSRAIGFFDAIKGVPYLDAFATQSADGRTVTALLTSKSATAAIAAHVAIDGFDGPLRVRQTTLTGPTPDANTGTELPSIPGLVWKRQATFGPQGRLAQGGPQEIVLRTDDAVATPHDLTVRVPPHSLVLLRFERAAAP